MSEENKFLELYHLDVSKYVEKKQGMNYLSWSTAWGEFKKVYPDATYELVKDENGKCYFGDEDVGYMVFTRVTAGGITYEMWLPIMDGANKAIKMKPYKYSTRSGEKSVGALSIMDVNKAAMRCLTKNIAIHGMGLYIYSGEDLPEERLDNESEEDDTKEEVNIKPMIVEINKLIKEKQQSGIDKSEIGKIVKDTIGTTKYKEITDVETAQKLIDVLKGE